VTGVMLRLLTGNDALLHSAAFRKAPLSGLLLDAASQL
jgi:hypothetical protein